MQTHVCPQAPSSSWELAQEFPWGQAALCVPSAGDRRLGLEGPGPGLGLLHTVLCKVYIYMSQKVPLLEGGPQIGNMATEGYDRTLMLAPSATTCPKMMWFFVENCNPKPKPQGLSGWY